MNDTLGEYVDIILGGTPKTSIKEYWGGQIPWVSVVDFSNTKRIYITEKTITEDGLNKSNTKLLKEGDIILSARGTVGKLTVCAVPMAFNQSCYALRAKDSKTLHQNYLYYQMGEIVRELKQKAVGGVFDTIIKSTIENIEVKFPPLPTQQKIASILSAYDDLIENNGKRIKLLEEAARNIYKEWFVHFRFPGHEKAKFREDASPNHKGRGLPEGWLERELNDLCDVTSSKRVYLTDYVKEGVPFYRGKEIIQKSNHSSIAKPYYISLSRFSEFDQKFGSPKTGDILLTGVGTIGHSYLVNNNDGDFYFKDGNLIWLRKISDNSSSEYIFLFLKSEEFKGIVNSINIGSSQKALTIRSIKSIKIVLPKKEVINQFVKNITPILSQIEKLSSLIVTLKEARDILLPRLMDRRIEV